MDEGKEDKDISASGDTLASKERMISESPVMWPEQPFCECTLSCIVRNGVWVYIA